ncbi:2-hydroxyacyl-CoA dehydratase [Neomoorella mulderi]|uniref:2-hydroxyglutaryl-CoA dehydratase, D-component n=1 Tax=Moorella mulderi DSM 14980 TaxID=1122241 RepID=A0A151ATJ5_9FIRM|nr:2-hydroxyacyl-CoA dehydratase [Moorella mulderi]KYH30912.1 2-hydroxyglutaryl-CoA dehydratase, D-component [Moorella mulderi DSM 14980]
MKKVSFAHMGYSYLGFKQLVEDMGFEAVVPPSPSPATLDRGVTYAPEYACIPFKMVLGTYLEVLERGAEMIITSGGVGPCRAGLYGMMHERILRNLGFNFEIFIFDPPLTGLWPFFIKLRRILKAAGLSWLAFVDVVRRAWAKLKLLDELEQLATSIRPYELKRGETTRTFHSCLKIVDQARTLQELAAAREECRQLLQNIPRDTGRRPLKVGIVGEIYVLLEPFMNLEIEKTLGEMGVVTHRSIYLTQYTATDVLARGAQDVRQLAHPYLNQFVGGHGQNSVGETILYARNGFDGVIQLSPFTCIPEIVAKSILPRVSRDLGIPILSLTIDEQTGRAGVETRLEAFVDLLRQRREQMEARSNAALLPGY